MGVVYLDIANFRNLAAVNIAPVGDGFNFFYGNNGSGKTSLLEAVYYLSLGRSFRSSVTERVVSHSAEKFTIFAHLAAKNDNYVPIGLERHQSGEIKIRADGKEIRSIGELASLTPVQLIDSHCHHLLELGPALRRKYLDWGLFHNNPSFLLMWRQFERALQQRNAGLRSQLPKKELDNWTDKLAEYALQLDELRATYAQQLTSYLKEAAGELLPVAKVEIDYQSGWDTSQNYREILERAYSRDLYLGYTQLGPHKADLKIKINGVPAKDILSRGQQKLFVCAMIVARGALLYTHAHKRPIYLVDDLPAELDSSSRMRLITLLSQQTAQKLVTAVQREDENSFLIKSPLKMFHVEHGYVTEV